MPRIKDMVGYETGRFKVLELSGRDKHGAALWKCQCACGNVRFMTRGALIDGRHISCGCYRRDRMSKLMKKPIGEGARNRVYFLYQHSAKRRKLCFELSLDTFIDIIQKSCYYCGSPPSNLSKSEHNTGDYIYSGIDRKNSNIGYIKDNCVPCCIVCNRAKNNMSFEEFKDWIKMVVDYNS